MAAEELNKSDASLMSFADCRSALADITLACASLTSFAADEIAS